MTSFLHGSPEGVATFPTLNRELLVFLALFRQEIQNGESGEPLTRFDLNRILEGAVECYLNGERL